MSQLIEYCRLGIKTKLYCVALLSIAAVATLASASFHFVKVTEQAAHRLYHDGFEGIERSAQLQSLLEQHRRLVESAPAEVDRRRLEAAQRATIEKSSQLSALITELRSKSSNPVTDAIETQMAAKMPRLVNIGQDVLFYAHSFAQDKALDSASGYAMIADEFEQLIRDYRALRKGVADAAVLGVSHSARALTFWVSFTGLAALLLIGPLGLTITRSVLARLARITKYMNRLAQHELADEVPSRGDLDELGAMARAIQVFKNDGVELLERKCQLERVNFQLDIALNNMTHGLSMYNGEQELIICNGRYGSMYDLPPELMQRGTRLHDILRYRKNRGNLGQGLESALLEAAHIKEAASKTIKELPDGRFICISREIAPDGTWVSVHEDISERRKVEARITHLVRHDQLTDLPNRTYFHEELEQAVHRLRRGKHFAVHCLDLDRFKGINDTMGHPIGDVLLRAVGERLRDSLQRSDFLARLGGDEFAIIQMNVERPEDCSTLAARLIETISAPYMVEGQQIIIGTSIGIAVAPADGANPDQLLRNADMAMYRAKSDGRGAYRLFEPEMDARIQARRALEYDLRNAMTSDELQLYYQPVVNTKTGQVVGMEALLRWFHPQHGEMSPTTFIPIAEETGLIGPLGEWIFRSACAEACKWPSDIWVAVNVSSAQVKNGNIAQVILSAIAASGLPASRLEIEITESILLENDTSTLTMLRQLRSLGVRVAMDDFGTGYSSLSYLRTFPLDKIKIDRSFIRDVSDKSEARAIVQAITSLARALNIDVVAEGVETAEQLRIVQAEGCTEVQGYFFSRARPAVEIAETIARCSALMKLAA